MKNYLAALLLIGSSSWAAEQFDFDKGFNNQLGISVSSSSSDENLKDRATSHAHEVAASQLYRQTTEEHLPKVQYFTLEIDDAGQSSGADHYVQTFDKYEPFFKRYIDPCMNFCCGTPIRSLICSGTTLCGITATVITFVLLYRSFEGPGIG